MRHLHLEKRGLRGLAIAESFAPGSRRSVLAGVVMRRDLVIDGFVLGHATLSGDDATDAVLDMYGRLGRPDISYVLLSGLIISRYNIVDIGRIHRSLGIPVIGVTYSDSGGIRDVEGRFGAKKMVQYKSLARRQQISLGASDVFVRCEGCTAEDAQQLLCGLTLQGSRPEPLRVAQLLARTAFG